MAFIKERIQNAVDNDEEMVNANCDSDHESEILQDERVLKCNNDIARREVKKIIKYERRQGGLKQHLKKNDLVEGEEEREIYENGAQNMDTTI